ncbi:hypothetical protein [Rheinheimera salexigens]|uniref:Uncharacterized protein n=1 Tax=Rheinheimera salexigens TaxID=1628148 RepID=A0A1E7Q7F8_9GAMM|nr:hypothetical protein [Rheinheimera salexigens]OEY70132.1 hypothetical protein BI198_11580 [Rheinheimera salexigens]
MLVVAQFPIADFRPFLTSGGERLIRPSWPPKTSIPCQFLRSFGPAMPRYRGIDWAWTDEVAFCLANRALRFVRLPNGVADWQKQLKCAFRRLLSDGEAVVRLEVGFSCDNLLNESTSWKHWDSIIEKGADPTINLPDINPMELIAHITNLNTVVPQWFDPKSSKSKKPLVLQGKALAKLYHHATSSQIETEPNSHWQQRVGLGAPIVLVECQTHWITDLPTSFIRVDSNQIGNVQLAFGRVYTSWGPLSVWVLGLGKLSSTTDIRNLRLCLLRLHAEQEVLVAMLDKFDNGTLTYSPEHNNSDKLEAYFNKATRLIERKHWAGIDQSAILKAFDAVADSEFLTSRMNLSQRLDGVRRQISTKLERFNTRSFAGVQRHFHMEEGAVYVGEGGIMESKIINIGAGAKISAPVIIADSIQNSFNAIQNSETNPEVTELMQQLLKQITLLAQTMPVQTKVMAKDAEALSNEVVSEVPRRKWYELSLEGIKEAAAAMGEVGKPIIETTIKLLPLLVKLFP